MTSRIDPIVPSRRWEFLTQSELDRLREAVFAVLAQVGVRFPLARALDILEAHGAAVDRRRELARLPQALVHILFTGALLCEAAQQVVIEEFLEGDEISFLCLSDGKYVLPLAPAQDHKRIGEGDTGPNTGGMGVYSTDTMLDPGMTEWILAHIATPTIYGMASEDTPFTGVLYCGLMMTARGPQVLEFNVRFGDPETQAILLRLESDLVEALEACIDGRLAETELRWSPGASACVVASSAGYPGSYKTGFPITGLSAAARVPGVQIFHSGSALSGDQLLTAGGRVLGVTAAAPSLEEALDRVYQAMQEIHFDGIYYRRDIGHRSLRRKR